MDKLYRELCAYLLAARFDDPDVVITLPRSLAERLPGVGTPDHSTLAARVNNHFGQQRRVERVFFRDEEHTIVLDIPLVANARSRRSAYERLGRSAGVSCRTPDRQRAARTRRGGSPAATPWAQDARRSSA